MKARKAMILAAGLGTRMQPFTNDKPKALLEYNGIPLLEHVITKLKSSGFKEIIINIHHFPDQIVSFVKSKNYFDIRIEFSDESEKLRDTGGGIKKAEWFLEGAPFLVYNVDIISNIDLEALYQFHLKHEPLATMAVKARVTSRSLLMGRDRSLVGWRDNRTGDQILIQENIPYSPIAFSAIHMLSPEIFGLFGDDEVFSIIDIYLKPNPNKKILLFRHDHDQWMDMGKLESLQ